MRIHLCFPPMAINAVAFPYPSLALLGGYIKANSKHEVAYLDINADFLQVLTRDSGKNACTRDEGKIGTVSELGARIAKQVEALRVRGFDANAAVDVARFFYWRLPYSKYYAPKLYGMICRMINSPSRLAAYEQMALDRLAVLLDAPELTFDLYKGLKFRMSDPSRTDTHYLIDQWKLSFCQLREILTSKSESVAVTALGKRYFDRLIDAAAGAISIVGFSVPFASQLGETISLAKFLKQHNPRLFVVVGGAFVRRITGRLTQIPEVFDVIDCFVEGPGERILNALADCVEQSRDWRCLAGITFRSRDHKVISNQRERFDLEGLAQPDYSWVVGSKYLEPYRRSVRASIGCYWNRCRFCTLADGDYRQRNVDAVVSEMTILSLSGQARLVQLIDDGVHLSRLGQIADRLIRARTNVYWGASTRFDGQFIRTHFDEAFCKRLIRSGCISLGFGLEAGAQRVNDLMNKGVNLADAQRVLDLCRRYGLRVNVGTVVGFPGEREGEIRATLRFLRRNRSPFFGSSVNVFSLEEGSYVFNHPAQFGITDVEDTSRYLFKENHVYAAENKLPYASINAVLREEVGGVERRVTHPMSGDAGLIG